ncbi:NAD(P)/FAD-dependent oxidoreductase [Flagellimonas onchidii]|uniref:NAD(P)/FAD-dependent oxidoreductase n=1 Tax=Flagellimonas onchidii TaxID=2562684 RepID=UPI0010A6186A|nr:FAD-dependent oxidoreductase [Allomuricauda onchidii]
MSKNKNVIVVGGGIIGLSTAYFLHKEGHRVTVLDKSGMNGGASHVNAGYITPSHIASLASPGMISKGIKYMFDSSSPFYMKPRLNADFIKWAWNFKKSSTRNKVEKAMPIIRDINLLSRTLYERIKDSGELGNFHFDKKGLLMVYKTQKARDQEAYVAKRAKELDLEVVELDSDGLRKVEPNIELNALGAFHYECDRHSTPTQFMERMIEFLSKQGVAIHKNEEVIDIESNGDNISTVITDKGSYKTDELVFSAGSWTSSLSKKLGIKLLLQAGKGYRINVESQTNISMPAILMESKMAVTPMDGFTRFSGTMEFSGINHKIRRERVEAIAMGAQKFYSGLKIPKEDINNAQCGLRPVTPDGLPYIGRTERYKNLVIATGHAMMGWSLGPATGKLITELVSEKKLSMDITPFVPERRF